MFGASTAYGYHQPATFGTTPPSTLVGPNTWSSRMRTLPWRYASINCYTMYAQLRTLVSLSCLPQCPSSSFAQSRRFLALPWPFAALMRFPRLHTLYHTSCPFTPVFLFLSLSLSLSLSFSLSFLVPRHLSIVSCSHRLVCSSPSLSLVPRPSSIVNRQSFCLVLVSSRLVSSRLVCSSPSLSISLSLSLSFSSLPPLSLSFSLSFSLSLSTPFAHLSYQERTGAPRQTLVLEVGTVGGACWHKSPPTGSGVLGFGIRASTSASSFPLPLIDADTSYRTECHVMSYRPIRSVCIDERQKLPG